MTAPSDINQLRSDDWNRLQEVLARFEQEYRGGNSHDLEAYLPEASDSLRLPLLFELVQTDLELHWKDGKRVYVERYLERFPELLHAKGFPSLLCNEYRVRHRHGESVSLTDYEQRFPRVADSLKDLFDQSDPTLVDLPQDTDDTLTGDPPSIATDVLSVPADAGIPPKIKLIRKIGEGGFGEVWRAEAPGGVPIAIKRIFGSVSPRAIERERESLDLFCSGKLRHPFLLQIFGWWIEEDQLHIAMELADTTLEEQLRISQREGLPGIPCDRLHPIMIDAADALDFLNLRESILHRDVKPANMLLMADRIKLGDFGLSRMTESLALAMGKTMGAGTPVFMAPEIVEGYQSIHSDQYSLAISYYMLRTGKSVFRGRAAEIRKQHLFANPKLGSDLLSDDERDVLLKALSKKPDERFPSCEAFIRTLIDVQSGKTSDGISHHVSTLDQGEILSSIARAVEQEMFDQEIEPEEGAKRPQKAPISTKDVTNPPQSAPISSQNEQKSVESAHRTPLESRSGRDAAASVNERVAEPPAREDAPPPEEEINLDGSNRKWNRLYRPGSGSYQSVPKQETPRSGVVSTDSERSRGMGMLAIIVLAVLCLVVLVAGLFLLFGS
ncbi:Serine/threonine-protein kinase PknF [Planctomycetes bacterium Pan216]|uniref:mitogen-activated protein kinase kinase n=1 Tax=Kolteria novifilia TaxID=2527975 RepID=A0A518B5K7_9BACT|nr:Serine/threonine-protein kinase PknF [Planctomycetes bacterium Pan216]